MKGIYNPKKLTTDRERFHKIRVLNIGAGAVGSAAVEHEAKLCLSLDVIDDDRFEPDNAAKRSCLVRTPEDDGSNKALCLGHRVQPLLDAVTAYLPSPLDVEAIGGHDPKDPSDQQARKPSVDEPMSALIFKIELLKVK